ncbi:MAG: chromosome condensation protein CrcB [Sulfurimonas sp. RIFOXYD12_FULL_33_39]|uniref:fluoride efflux transporter CrcB n=1 Tax=unclassified Sulfurimonas TaxID=2623549 RepID=UPI0008C05C94|nr:MULTISPECIES: fluoride efflux transporter CrcB [unclassified Sulfurimonas]OHE01420.1 MAG: chromosome condensation protein CrcB [Sulfurimonas sp. RIFCSPLOWO2_12_FULL_34_6]OHE08779.1 MAG: chromosome condensation protein CrcB [Sulfurimonas sp. RIFOXYD12_FULL_33_39]OHE14064.1 MAG: chromosome condensation protein CrcB [Sulfurimonas sp. RIFOXYD2_FULL_34_21]DAB27530.1 MAG TPA: fluoride efflux transporter CrcB [Sulfurimonas sp. UBA10385]
MSWQTILAIGSGGFLGAVLRAYLNGLISNKVPHDLPFGTLGVNLIGSFIMGILIAYFMYTAVFSLHVKSFLSTGILGALTTYSTFAIESFFLIEGGHLALAAANISLNAFGSIFMAGSGFYIVKQLLKS